MESPYNGKNVNGAGVKPKAWYCDICEGYFIGSDAGWIGESFQSCEECRERNFDTSEGESLQ